MALEPREAARILKPTLVRDVLDSEGNVIRPFEPQLRWDITKDPVIHIYDENSIQTGEMKTVEPWVVQMAKQAMRLVVTDGTAVGAWDGIGEARSTKPVDEVGIKPGAAVLVNTGVLWRLGTIGREGVPL